MRRCLCIITVCILFSVCFAACEPKVDLPDGVHVRGDDNYYYAIKLPDGKSASDYFTFTGAASKMIVSMTDGVSYSDTMGFVYHCAVSEGGWVIYNKEATGIIIYLPEGFPEGQIQAVCASFALGVKSYMTIEEAKTYIGR